MSNVARMCGIAGLFTKSPALREQLGGAPVGDAAQLSDRGPDSAGVAFYRDPAPLGCCKVSLYSAAPDPNWEMLGAELERQFGGASLPSIRATHCTFIIEAEAARRPGVARRAPPGADADERRRRRSRSTRRPARRESSSSKFKLSEIEGSHALGHTRMATESRVTTEHSHPFSTGLDLCLVHNGSLSNHNRLRRSLQREGIRFQTDNDSEVAAGLSDLAAARGRVARAGARGLPRRPRWLLHVCGRDRGPGSRSCAIRSHASPP